MNSPMTREQLTAIYGRMIAAAATGEVDMQANQDRVALFSLVEHLVVVRDQARNEVKQLTADRGRIARTNEVLASRIRKVRSYAEHLGGAYPIPEDQHLANIIRGVVLRYLDGGDSDDH